MAESLAPAVAPDYIYKIVPPESFNTSDKVLPLSDLDRTDGFYHLSTAAQVPGTSNRFFLRADFDHLLILKLSYPGLAPQIRWEAARGNSGNYPVDTSRIFPHVYGDLELKHCVGTIRINWDDAQNQWSFPTGWEHEVLAF